MKICTKNLGPLIYSSMDYVNTVAYHNRNARLIELHEDSLRVAVMAEEIELGILRIRQGRPL